MTILEAAPRSLITDPHQVEAAANALAAGAIVAHAFGNIYAITTRADVGTVRAVNLMKGRPLNQVGSVTGPPLALAESWDLDRLPRELSPRTAFDIVDALFALGPFGFRGPAAAAVPAHLTQLDGELRTAQVIAPGYRCPSNGFLAAGLLATGDDLLYITSANRSRHLTGADDSPAHWRADGLRAEFGDEPGLLIIEHPDDTTARHAYPLHLPMSTTVLGLHRVVHVQGDRRPHLIMERHGSLAAEHVRRVLAEFGYGLVLARGARTRLVPRAYSARSSERVMSRPSVD